MDSGVLRGLGGNLAMLHGCTDFDLILLGPKVSHSHKCL
jgi:hypothetical protein